MSTIRYHERRAKLIDLLGGECVGCGSREDLQFDHRDPAGKTLEISRQITYSLEVVLAEIEKCQLLCGSCHKQKTLDERGRIQHGTIGMYRHRRCRCEPCKSAWNTATRRWKKNRAGS
jgi:5-methylcytosine-specific restriction endonuclease McrA